MNIYNARAYINGELINLENKIETFSPIDNSFIGTVPSCTKTEIDYAFESANTAFTNWSLIKADERISYVLAFAEELLAKKDMISTLMVKEIAKAKKDCLVEIQRTYDYILQTVQHYKSDILPAIVIGESQHNIKGKTGIFNHVPLGVVVAISPFNYPINLSLAKIIPSIIVGNTVVFKPASQGSLTGLVLGEIFAKLKFPRGVVNIISGSGSQIGDYLISNKHIKGITFTGGTDVGINIAKSSYMKNLILELGGKDPAIVLHDINCEKVAKQIISGAFNYSGQRCTAIKRVLVLDIIADQLVKCLEVEIKKLTCGNPFDNVDIVPMISTKEMNYVQSLINDALDKNAKLIYGNHVIGNNLLTPTLIDNVSLDSKLAWEEPFGPVLPIIRLNTVKEIIDVANKSEYGLQASIFTNDKEIALNISRLLDTGTININAPSSRGPDIFPFIGVKNSGFGVQGIVDAMKSMTRLKGVVNND
ncbi:MAG: aldehyde dehydrogenase family protein [Malacoplasma sp.]